MIQLIEMDWIDTIGRKVIDINHDILEWIGLIQLEWIKIGK